MTENRLDNILILNKSSLRTITAQSEQIYKAIEKKNLMLKVIGDPPQGDRIKDDVWDKR